MSANLDLVRSPFTAWERGDYSSTARVLARGQTKRTGMDLEQMQTNVAVVYHVRGGKVVRLVLYLDRECALADLVLEG